MISDKKCSMDFPKVKKKVNGFLLNEEGKISRQAAVSVGGTLGVIALGSLASKSALAGTKATEPAKCDPKVIGNSEEDGNCWAHNNAIDNDYKNGELKSQHQHHYNHTSHSSHGSY